MVTLACNFFGKGLLKASAMLIGIIVGYIAALIMGGVVDFSGLTTASWFSVPMPFHFGLEFHPDAILMMILMYMVQAVQTIGDVSSTAMGGFGPRGHRPGAGRRHQGPGHLRHDRRLHRRPAHRPVQPERRPDLHTKVVSRRVFTMVGVIMLLAGIFPKFSGLMATIPQSVLGGATVTVFAAITMSGIQLLKEQPLNYRNRMIVGISLALGLGIDAAPEILQFAPQAVPECFRQLSGGVLPGGVPSEHHHSQGRYPGGLRPARIPDIAPRLPQNQIFLQNPVDKPPLLVYTS